MAKGEKEEVGEENAKQEDRSGGGGQIARGERGGGSLGRGQGGAGGVLLNDLK